MEPLTSGPAEVLAHMMATHPWQTLAAAGAAGASCALASRTRAADPWWVREVTAAVRAQVKELAFLAMTRFVARTLHFQSRAS